MNMKNKDYVTYQREIAEREYNALIGGYAFHPYTFAQFLQRKQDNIHREQLNKQNSDYIKYKLENGRSIDWAAICLGGYQRF